MIECLQVMEMGCVGQYEDGHDLTVRHLSLALAMTLAGVFYHMFFSTQSQNNYKNHRIYKKKSTKFAVSIGVAN